MEATRFVQEKQGQRPALPMFSNLWRFSCLSEMGKSETTLPPFEFEVKVYTYLFTHKTELHRVTLPPFFRVSTQIVEEQDAHSYI